MAESQASVSTGGGEGNAAGNAAAEEQPSDEDVEYAMHCRTLSALAGEHVDLTEELQAITAILRNNMTPRAAIDQLLDVSRNQQLAQEIKRSVKPVPRRFLA